MDKEKKISCPYRERGQDCPARRLVTIPTTLSRVFRAAYTFSIFLHIRARRWAFSEQTPPTVTFFLSPVMCYQWYKDAVATLTEPYVCLMHTGYMYLSSRHGHHPPKSHFGTWLDEHARNADRMASAVRAVTSNKPTQELNDMRFF